MKALHRSKLFWFLVVLAVAVIVVHVMLPIWVRNYVNKTLDHVGEYHGHVDSIGIALWRGAYKIYGIKIEKTTGQVPVPFFSAPLMDLSVQWMALFHGSFVGEINVVRPQLNFVNAPDEAQAQAGLKEPWTTKVKQLFPLKINRFSVADGEVHYRDYHRTPKVDVVFDRVRIVATNLTNSEKLSKTLNAHVEMEARPLRAGDLRVKIDLDPYAAKPTFNLETELKDLPLVKLNDFAKAYASITFEKGTLRMATELNSKNGHFDGYVEPVFDNMSIFSIKHDSDNPLDFVWQAIVGGLTQLIRSHSENRFGTHVPIHGTFDNPKPAIIATVLNVFRNAIIQVFEGTLPHKELPKVEKNPG
ncbi:MAG TPA: DUF748 domain-containing protein [Chthoniobacterales bacterium]|jgi:hypothetical protein